MTVILQTKDDVRWWDDAERHGWKLPPAAAAFWRRPPIRYFRALRAFIQVERHDRFFRELGLIPTGFDRWVIYAIWRGWC